MHNKKKTKKTDLLSSQLINTCHMIRICVKYSTRVSHSWVGQPTKSISFENFLATNVKESKNDLFHLSYR